MTEVNNNVYKYDVAVDNAQDIMGEGVDSEEELDLWMDKNHIGGPDRESIKNAILKGDGRASIHEVKDGLDAHHALQKEASEAGTEKKIKAFGQENTYTSLGDGKHWVRDDGKVYEINGFNGSGNLDLKETDVNLKDSPKAYGDSLVSVSDDGKVSFYGKK